MIGAYPVWNLIRPNVRVKHWLHGPGMLMEVRTDETRVILYDSGVQLTHDENDMSEVSFEDVGAMSECLDADRWIARGGIRRNVGTLSDISSPAGCLTSDPATSANFEDGGTNKQRRATIDTVEGQDVSAYSR
jgi:hypothetical protein